MARKKAAYTESHKERPTQHTKSTRSSASTTQATKAEKSHTERSHHAEKSQATKTSHASHAASGTKSQKAEKAAVATRSVKDVMTPRVVAVTSVTFLPEAAMIMRQEDVGALPVVQEDGKLLGIITDRDITVRAVADSMNVTNTRVAEVFTAEDLVTVSPATDLEEARDLMAEHQVRRLPVVEDGNRLVGMIAQADLALESGDQVQDAIKEISKPGGTHTQAQE